MTPIRMAREGLSPSEREELEHHAIQRLWAAAFRTMLPEAVRDILAAAERVRAEQGAATETEVVEVLGLAIASVRTFLLEHPRPLANGAVEDHAQLLAATIVDCLTWDETRELALVAQDQAGAVRLDPFGEDDAPCRTRGLHPSEDLAVARGLAKAVHCPDCAADEPEPDGAA